MSKLTLRAPFIVLWTLATAATVCAFLVHLALRGRAIKTGYELGRLKAEQTQLREVKRVLQLEAASYKNPERVEVVAKTLLGMDAPPTGRVIPMREGKPRPEATVASSGEPRP